MRRATPRNGGVGRYISYIQCVTRKNRYLHLKQENMISSTLSLKSQCFSQLPTPCPEKGEGALSVFYLEIVEQCLVIVLCCKTCVHEVALDVGPML